MAEWVGDDEDGDDDDVNGMPSWVGWIGGLVRGAVYEYSCVYLGEKKLFIALHREIHVVYILSNKCHAGRRMISCLSHIASSFTACNVSGDLIRYRVLYEYFTLLVQVPYLSSAAVASSRMSQHRDDVCCSP